MKTIILNNKQETLEEAAEKANGYNLYAKGTKGQAFNEGFIEGAKWQAERMYSEEEVKALFKQYQNAFPLHRSIQVLDGEFKEWFEQFKKK